MNVLTRPAFSAPPVTSSRSAEASPATSPGPAPSADSFEPGTVQEPPPVLPPTPPPTTYPRAMTDREKKAFHNYFPNLDVDQAMVTAEATPQYNCISWTTGNTASWDWPPYMYPDLSPRDAFVKYYHERGFEPTTPDQAAQQAIHHDKELVAYWEDAQNAPTHGSVSGPTHGERWESKCGQSLRIQHEREGLVGDTYGHIAGYYLKQPEAPPPAPPAPSTELMQRFETKLQLRLKAVDPGLKEKFQEAYSQWRQDREAPQVALSSDPADYCQGPGYQKLLSLGTDSLPLLMDKLQQGDFFAQYAVEKVSQKKPGEFQVFGLDPKPALAPREIRCSEQDKAGQILSQWVNSGW